MDMFTTEPPFAAEPQSRGQGAPGAVSPPPATRPSDAADSDARRRKIRKGTRSCWECKRRKIRCTFTSHHDTVCIGCRRRTTKCVSQEFPEEASAPADRSRYMGDRIVRVEALVEQLVKTVGTGAGHTSETLPGNNEDLRSTIGIPTPSASSDSGLSPPNLSLHELAENRTCDGESPHGSVLPPTSGSHTPVHLVPTSSSRYTAVIDTLIAAFPSRKDLETLRNSEGADVVFFNQVIAIPYSVLRQEGIETTDALFNPPDPSAHPVTLARHMLRLASFLQYLNPDIPGLDENPRVIMTRLADTAIRVVTTNDDFLGTLDGLECIMLEGLYQGNCGNLRRSWLAFRRAMVVGQLMGIQRPHQNQPLKVIEPRRRAYPHYLWFRIVYADRALSMMLGLPQGSLDVSMASPASLAAESPLDKLERMHCVLASRILDRNESDPSLDDYAKTQEIDLELQKAANTLPGKWWLMPNLAKINQTADAHEMFWETLRLLHQLFHYNLLNHLHLPYMLKDNQSTPGGRVQNYEYSKSTCVTASREILMRFIMFRSYNKVAFCCRTVDFYALIASMTLVLAHLDGHRESYGDNLLSHQRLSDRAMMEEVLENMDDVSRINMDAVNKKSSDLLRRILAIEAEAIVRKCRRLRPDLHPEDASRAPTEEHSLRISVPYFGVVKIGPEGIISKETVDPQRPPLSLELDFTDQTGDGVHPLEPTSYERASSSSTDPYNAAQMPPPVQVPAEEASRGNVSSSSHSHNVIPEFPNAIDDVLQQQYSYPALTACTDDWAFQGVDLAFFDSLMRGTGMGEDGGDVGNGGDVGTDWANWQAPQ